MHRILTIKVLLVLVPWISSGLPYTGIEYDELYEVADEKGKSVMLYYHHDHCAACEWMEQNVFPEEKVQHFIEENFVAFELDGNTEWGEELRRKYNISAAPAFFFVNPHEKVIHKFYGMKEKDEFLDEVEKAARDANETYSHYKEQYEEGKRDPEFLRNYAYVLRNAKKDDSLVVEQYISTLEEEDFYEPVNVWFIYDFALIDNRPVWSLESKPFRFMYDERSVFHEYYDENVIKPRLLVMTYLNLMDIAGEQYDELFKEDLPLIEEFEDELPLFDNGPGASIGFMTPDLKSQLLFVYHANAGDFDKAMGYMDVILENDLSDKLHFGLGNLMLQHLPADQEILKIIKDLKRPYFEKNPNNVFSKYSYAKLLDKMGKTERAQKYASEVLDELTMFNFNYVRYEEEIHNMKEIVKK